MTAGTLLVPARCNGPRASGNGGWTAGALAERVPGLRLGDGATVRLLAPPPLEVAMAVVRDGDGVRLERDGTVVAVASPTQRPLSLHDWPAVGPEAAALASRSYAGFASHPFPTCFSCGPERAEGDGLRIFPGRLADGRVAAPWQPHEVDVALTWAALDCVGGWSTDIDERPMVLGQVSVRVLRLPEPAADHVLVGSFVAGEGRKSFTRSALHSADGELLAHAEHVWVEVDPVVFQSLV